MDYENEEDDFLEQAQRRAKRNFLREEILESGYSGSQFTSFCEQERGADIDLWTFEELQDCIRRFKVKFNAEELSDKPVTEETDKEELQVIVTVPHTREADRSKDNPAAPHKIDTATRPKLVEVASSPLDSPKERPKPSPSLQIKTAYRSPYVDLSPAAKDPPRPVILIPAVRAESPKVPMQTAPKQEDSPKLTTPEPIPVPKRDESPKALLPPPKPVVIIPEFPIKLSANPEPRPVSDMFPITDGPASLLTLSDYSLPGHSLPSTEMSDFSGKLKVVIEK